MALTGENRDELEGALKAARKDLRDGTVEAMTLVVVREGDPKFIDCSTAVMIDANNRAKAKMAALLALQVKKICLVNGVDFNEVAKIADAIMAGEIQEDLNQMMKGKK